jgi:hypothetical protein
MAFYPLALVTITGCTHQFRPLPPATSANQGADPDEAIELVNASDGIDKAEAYTIASAYVLRFIVCGGPGVPTRHGHEWWSTPNVGMAAQPANVPIKIDARTGGVSFDAAAAGLSESAGKTFASIDDFRRFPIRIMLPFDTTKSWTAARIRQISEFLDASLRERHLGEARNDESMAPDEMLFDVFYLKSAVALLKSKLIELGAPASTVLDVDDRYRMTLDEIR